MRTLIDPTSPEAAEALACFRDQAIREGKQLLKIVWDEKDGYPEHSWGYVQWSVRPYEAWYGCDGTTDANIHLIACRMCERLGLNYAALYAEAYPNVTPWPPDMSDPYWQEVEQQTIIPDLTELTLCSVVRDLHEINNHSLATLVAQRFTALGYDVSDYWLRNPNRQ